MRRRKNKYGNVKTHYGGRTYDSKAEAVKARELDLRMKSGEIAKWTPQHKLKLVVNGSLISSYKIDFRAVRTDGTVEYIEVKGHPTYAWKIRWKLTQALFGELTEGEDAELYLNSDLVLVSMLHKNQ